MNRLSVVNRRLFLRIKYVNIYQLFNFLYDPRKKLIINYYSRKKNFSCEI